MGCEVRDNCKNPSWCADCVEGSNYVPVDKSIKHPARLRREQEKQEARRAWKQSAGFRRGKAAAKAGAKFEKEVTRKTGWEPVPLSGRGGGHDHKISGTSLRAECKHRDGGFRFLYNTLRPGEPGSPGLLVLQGYKHEPPLVVLTLERFLELAGNPGLDHAGDEIVGVAGCSG